MRGLLVAVGFAVSTASCSSPTVVDRADLVGTWQTTRESLSPFGSWQTTLTFESAGRVTREVRNYGLYAGQKPDDVSGYYRMTGTFQLVGDSLTIEARESVWWDRFYGADSPEHRETSTGTPFPSARVTVDGDRLTVDYVSYPADAPVATTMTFIRVH